MLGEAVTVKLFTEFPDLDEGQLAKRRASLVSTVALAEIARGLGLGRYLRLGNGEELTGGRDKSSILADTVEAIIGACYLQHGHERARDFVLELVRPLWEQPDRFGAAMDPKTSLQELLAELGMPNPIYELVATGPDHDKRFTATVRSGGEELGTGSGTSKKQAEMGAALDAWTALQSELADA